MINRQLVVVVVLCEQEIFERHYGILATGIYDFIVYVDMGMLHFRLRVSSLEKIAAPVSGLLAIRFENTPTARASPRYDSWHTLYVLITFEMHYPGRYK